MFAHALKLVTVAGFPIRVDPSWLLLAGLITWSLGGPGGVFPELYPELAPAVCWAMGAAGALGLFTSILLHELAHALVARRFGLHIRSITLFIFGGVAEMTDEPPSPRAEFLVAVAGPLASIAIGGACFGAAVATETAGWPLPVYGVLGYLAMINLVVVLFNLVPAFPLDGGRMLRAALWRWRRDLGWATGIAARIGGGFGLALMALGIVGLFRGEGIGGLWQFLIGLFLRNAAQASRRQQALRRMLEGERVRDFMITDPVVVPRHVSVREFVDDYVYRHPHKIYPVEQDGRLVGCVSLDAVKELPRDEWPRQTVGRLTEPCGTENTVSPEEDALRALATMHRTGHSRMLVVQDGRLVGLVALKDLLRLLALKVELEDPAQRAVRRASD
jgi:Zn-dependent protease/CBS domain-containing protein